MAKYLVETYYTCTFKVNHYLDDINENELKKLEKRDDGKFEVLDVKLDNRKTKNLDPNNKKVFENKKNEIVSEINSSTPKNLENLIYSNENKLETIKFICIQVNMKMVKLVKFLLIRVKKESQLKL